MSIDDADLERAEHARRLDDHERVLQELAETVAEQRSVIKELSRMLANPDAEPKPWQFYPIEFSQSLKREKAEIAWEKLTLFVDKLLIPTYDDSYEPLDHGQLREGKRIKSCWFAHPDCVERFSQLYWGWLGDFKTNAPISGPLDWGQTWINRTLDAAEKSCPCSFQCKRFMFAMGLSKDDPKGPKSNGWLESLTKEKLRNPIHHMDREAFIAKDIAQRRPAEPVPKLDA